MRAPAPSLRSAAANIRRRYEAELSFYRQVWRIGAASEAEGQDEETFTVKVENLH